jgi:endonuclease/exonuclease/phosphatase family metal-dependent hydrolase
MRFTNFILLGGLASLAAAKPQHDFDVRLMTYNIRYAATNPTGQEKPWAVRRPLMAGQLAHELAGRPDSLLCLQEALHTQVLDIKADLGQGWEYVGVGRDDGATGGELSPIFYRPDEWKLKDKDTYWLSETPHVVGSVGWDAALPRIVTVAKFEHTETGKPFVYMCTHFDHKGQVAREKSAELIVDIADEWASAKGNKGASVFLGGDLNVDPENPAYQTLASKLHDVRDVVPQELHYGHDMTFTGFDSNVDNDSLIDHLFVKDLAGLEWESFAVLNTLYEDGTFISDHRPVVVDVRVPGKKSPRKDRRRAIRGSHAYGV